MAAAQKSFTSRGRFTPHATVSAIKYCVYPPTREFTLNSDLEQRLVDEARKMVVHVTPDFIDTKESEISPIDLGKAIRSRMELRNKHKLTQYSARVRMRLEHPALVVLLGDTHYGSGDSDHERIDRDIGYILDTPGVYVAFLSNLIDNAIPGKFPDGMLQNILPPEEQVVGMRQYVRELDEAGKVLAAITSPCHEGWTWQKAGQDINRLLFGYEGRKFPILENGGKLILNLNDQSYYFALYHQLGPFNSNLNKNNGTQRMKQLQHRNADIVAAAHHHVAEAMQTFTDKGTDMKPVCYMRTGCYKLDDQWAAGKGYIKGEPGGQSVRLDHRQKRMQPYLNIEQAVEEHRALMAYHKAVKAA